jgi:glycosyltransferase involved in cell wall biosynthesis
MKILYISRAILPSEISHSLSIMRVCQAFSDEGHKVVLIGIKPHKEDVEPIKYYGLKGGFEVIRIFIDKFFKNKVLNKLQLVSLYLAFKNKNIFDEFQPDIIYSRLTLLELLCIPKKIPIIYEMHSLGFFGKSWIQKKLFLWMIKNKNFKQIVVTTNILKELLEQYLPKGLDIVVARLSAETPITVSLKEIEEFKNQNLLGGNFEKHVGYTGYLDRVGLRGTDIICQTASFMGDVAFHVVGGEPDVVDYWKEYSKQYNNNNNIFFYGYRNPNEMPLFLNCFDIVLAPLQYKPCLRAPTGANMSPLKLPQYMGYAKAIIASDIPSHREVLRNEQNALLVTHDNPQEWKYAIERLLQDLELKQKLTAQALSDYESDFTPTIRVQKILKHFL